MPRAYISRDLVVAAGDGDTPSHFSPEAARAIETLRECGWDVVVIGGTRAPDGAGLGSEWLRVIEDRDPGAWLLTGQVADDRWARPLGLKTALVGPNAEQQAGPARCDVAFRDLRTAALEILSIDIPSPGAARS